MKKIFLILTLLTFIACGGNVKNTDGDNAKTAESVMPAKATPSEVAAKVFNALTSGDAQPVKDGMYFENPQNGEVFFQYLDMAVSSSQYGESVKGYEASYTAEKETIDNDTAHVELVGFDTLGNKVRFIVRLQNVDGAWKVHGEHSVFHNTTGNAQ